MVRVVKIEIAEEAETLKKLLVQQKDKRTFERVQALYLQQLEAIVQKVRQVYKYWGILRYWCHSGKPNGTAYDARTPPNIEGG